MAKWVFEYGMHGYLPNFQNVYEGTKDEVIQHVLEFISDDSEMDITGAKESLNEFGSWDFPGDHNLWYVSIEEYDPYWHGELEGEYE